jgi:tetratricopeptide (TPR) repeat protein
MLSGSNPFKAIVRRGRRRMPAARRARVMLAAFAMLLPALLMTPRPALAQDVKGEASVSTSGGFGRLVIRFNTEVESSVRMSGNVLIVQFKQPVDVPVNRITTNATEYIGAARRDPDGRALRFALAQKVKVSSMTAGERLFVDLLPESWTGEPPGLPREVVEELARRAHEAERLARQRLALEEQRKIPAVRVRVASQPTFTRYIFELPELIGVTSERGKDKLTLSFAKSLRFDLSDAKLALPKVVDAVDASSKADMSEVRFAFSQQADVRTFREDSNFVVDVSPVDARSAGAPAARASGPLAGIVPPQTVPALTVPEAKPPAVTKPKVAGETPAKPAAALQPPPAAAAKEPAAATAPAGKPHGEPSHSTTAELRRQGDNLRLFFPFAQPTPAAVFQRADTLWLVFDTDVKFDITALLHDPSKTIRDATVTREDDAQVVRLKLERPRLTSVEPQEGGWLVTVGEAMRGSTKPLLIARNIVAPGRTSIAIPFDDPAKQHRLSDSEIGDKLLVVTGLGPARGLIKSQDFVELRALATAHGIAVAPIADDLKAELSADKVLLLRPSGLTLSDAASPKQERAVHAVTFDSKLWSVDRDAEFTKRQFELLSAAAEAPYIQRTACRMDLARFYFSRQMFAEAKAVLDTTIADEQPTSENPAPLVLRAVASIMLGRFGAALKDLANPAVGDQNDALLWRALVYARQGKWAEARDAFRYVEGALGSLPLELQRIALQDALRASIEVGDYASAVGRLNDFQTIGVSADIAPAVAVLAGRLAEGVGRINDALAAYRSAAASANRPAAAQGRLRELVLRYSTGDLKKPEYIGELEILTTAWRGDETEVEALQKLAQLYTEESRYRDAFHVMRVALTAYPGSTLTRNIHDEAAKTFDGLFLAGKGDALPAIDALSLFYDFRELTPIGRRGDEMIRRLAERLVSVDLLDQAAELLQYQVDNRLQGAARAQVATRLAVIYLLNHKPDRAQATLRATRTADLANEIRIPRLLIEARALSDLGRHDFALEVIDGIEGRESLRLRADIYWAARRWQKAAEHIELLYGDRWKGFEPLTDAERPDLLRAGVAYALAEDKIGIARLRDKFAAKMSDGPDRRAFDLVTGGLGPNSAEFREVARVVASGDTMAGFMRDLKARYPEMQGVLSGSAGQPAGAKPEPANSDAKPEAKSDPASTGSIFAPAPRRVSAR